MLYSVGHKRKYNIQLRQKNEWIILPGGIPFTQKIELL